MALLEYSQFCLPASRINMFQVVILPQLGERCMAFVSWNKKLMENY